MFWNKKVKSPISKEDQEWLHSDLSWLREAFTEAHFQDIQTITPTKNFYNRDFDGSEDDAQFILERTKELMGVKNDKIELKFFNDSPTLMPDGSLLSTPSDTIDGSWNGAAGYYEQNEENEVVIGIEIGQLKNTTSLIATISHELAHEILLGEDWLEKNDEFLTDLTVIFYGFGIFQGNSQFSFSTYRNGLESGWESKAQGYLPVQVIAYAVAWLSLQRNENTSYKKFLNKSMKRYFEQSLEYLKLKEEE